MIRGLRPSPYRDDFPSSEIEEAERQFQRMANNTGPNDERDFWRINQALKVAQLRRAADGEEKDSILQKINEHEKEGHRLNFQEIKIRAINKLVIKKEEEGRLGEFIEFLESLKEKGKLQ
jgi:Holliday junction resolvase